MRVRRHAKRTRRMHAGPSAGPMAGLTPPDVTSWWHSAPDHQSPLRGKDPALVSYLSITPLNLLVESGENFAVFPP